MDHTMKSASERAGFRLLSSAEMEAASGGLTQQERLDLQRRLTEAYQDAHKDDLGRAIKDRFHL